MRRWVCIIALLAGFSADGYTRGVRPRLPIAIERPVDTAPPAPPARAPLRAAAFTQTADWWGRSSWGRS